MKKLLLVVSCASLCFIFSNCRSGNKKDQSANTNDTSMKFEQPEGSTTIDTGNTARTDLDLQKDSLLFLPVIRNYTNDDLFATTGVYKPIGDQTGAFIARVKVKANGATGIDYVLKNDLGQYKITEEQVLQIALRNLGNAKLEITGMDDKSTGDKMISISSDIGLATAILFDTHFIDKLKADLKAKELTVTIINSGQVYLTTRNSSFEKGFPRIVEEGNYNDVVNVHAATYLWTNGSLRLLTKYRD